MNTTAIEWTDRTANPIRARHKATGKVGHHCVKHSTGCAHCYSERWNRWVGTGLPFTAHSADQVELFLDKRPLEAILRLKKPSKIFLCDMTDLFQDGVSDDDILRIWCVMEEARQHTFQVLTKRPERMRAWVDQHRQGMAWSSWPLPNVWLGTSVENQRYADERIPHLLATPAAVRFLSVEPLLGPVNLTRLPHGDESDLDALRGEIRYTVQHRAIPPRADGARIDQVIVGGESGPKARPCDVASIRSLVAQCKAAGVAAFVKQFGAAPYDSGYRISIDGPDSHAMMYDLRDRKGGDWDEWPEDLRVREFPHPVAAESEARR